MSTYAILTATEALAKALPGAPAKGRALADDAHRSAPKGYPKDKTEYAIPSEFKYPLDSEEHVRAAITYFSRSKNGSEYSKAEQRSIWARIIRAAKKAGIDVSDEVKKRGTVEKSTQHSLVILLK